MSSLKRILLVEDSPQDAELTLHALADSHLADEVLHVRDGAEALDYVYRRGRFTDRPTGQPVLMLLDLKMPKVDGIEVLRQMKNDRALKTIAIVVLTSSREDADVLRSYELGVNAYVVKPVPFREFMDTVKQIGSFWAMVNEPPPGSLHAIKGPGPETTFR